MGELRHDNTGQSGGFQGSESDSDMDCYPVHSLSRRVTHRPPQHVDCDDEQFVPACGGKNYIYIKGIYI